jgi:hypothetical protein
VTFGMLGDVPTGWPKNKPPPDTFNYNYSIWWRPGGFFSKPLLANPQFRKLFLARTKELLETVYTEKVFFPLIEKMGEQLKEEVKIRAQVRGQDPKWATEHLRRNVDSLKEHMTKRRKFLLDQDEIKKAGKFDRSLLQTGWFRPFDAGPAHDNNRFRLQISDFRLKIESISASNRRARARPWFLGPQSAI